MNTDILIFGAELDALIAALRLSQRGHGVRVLAAGAGSLHYAPGGIHMLGYLSEGDGEAVSSPMAGISALDVRHPYRLLGAERIESALDWFFAAAGKAGLKFRVNGANVTALTPAGLGLPVYAPTEKQATMEDLRGRKVAVVRFRGHRDLPAGIVVSGLSRQGIETTLVTVDPPGPSPESIDMARAFDGQADFGKYFAGIKACFPEGTECALFPAVLGLDSHNRVAGEAEAALGMPCLEVPTLPPSVPGIRLYRALTRELERNGVLLHLGVEAGEIIAGDGKCTAVRDDMGRVYEASAFIVATGGVLMGGLDVDSFGKVRETTFALEVFQGAPLDAQTVDRSLAALHQSGVECDASLRPVAGGKRVHDNLFVTGRTLGHWNPSLEASSEGVSIATGWAAAEEARIYLEGEG